jgi:hypothetical protein
MTARRLCVRAGPPVDALDRNARAWRAKKERLVPRNERIFMNNGAATCVAVQGAVDDPAVLLVGSSMLSWPNELCDRLVAGGRG